MRGKRFSNSVLFIWSDPFYLSPPGTISELLKEEPSNVYTVAAKWTALVTEIVTFKQVVRNVFKFFLMAESLDQTWFIKKDFGGW